MREPNKSHIDLHGLAYILRGAVHVLTTRLPYVTLLLRVRGNTDVNAD